MDYEFWMRKIGERPEWFERKALKIDNHELEFFVMEPLLKVKYFTILAKSGNKFLIIVSRDYGKFGWLATYHEFLHAKGLGCGEAARLEMEKARESIREKFEDYRRIRIKAFESLLNYAREHRDEYGDIREFERALEVYKSFNE